MRGGHDIDVAVSMLNALEQALHAFERHREFIMKRLKDDNDPRALILKRAPIGDNQDDYDVLENGVIVGRIFTVPTAPEGRPWMWAIRERTGRTVAHGYDPTREAAMAAFAKSWRWAVGPSRHWRGRARPSADEMIDAVEAYRAD